MALSDLIRPRTREQVVQRMLIQLATDPALGQNFTPSNYVPGDPLRTLLELAGEGVADAERYIAQLAEGGYLHTAQGAWLTELVRSHFGLDRQGSTFARGLVRFAATAAGAVAMPAGMIVGTLSGRRYLTLEAASVPAGGTADVPVQAESPGTAYNVPVGVINVLHTPLPGLSVTNPPGWLTQAGADEESDVSLRARAGLRWAELGGGATRAAYEYWALSAHPSVDRVRVLDEHPRGQGTVDVIVWGTGGLGELVVDEVDAFIQARRPITADVLVYAATERVMPFTVRLYAPGVLRPAVEADVLAGLERWQLDLGIGGRVYAAQVIEEAMRPAGVLDATTTLRDTVLGATEAATLAPVIEWRDTP